jgi:hypothetical protein
MDPKPVKKQTGRKPGAKSVSTNFFRDNAEARRQYELYRLSKGKGTTKPIVEIFAPAPQSEGELPKISAAIPGAPPIPGVAPTVTVNPPDDFDPKGCAESIAGFSGMACNLILWKQGRETITPEELEVYAKEITPFVSKYRGWFKYQAEIRAVVATGALVWACVQKPKDPKRIIEVKPDEKPKEGGV